MQFTPASQRRVDELRRQREQSAKTLVVDGSVSEGGNDNIDCDLPQVMETVEKIVKEENPTRKRKLIILVFFQIVFLIMCVMVPVFSTIVSSSNAAAETAASVDSAVSALKKHTDSLNITNQLLLRLIQANKKKTCDPE